MDLNEGELDSKNLIFVSQLILTILGKELKDPQLALLTMCLVGQGIIRTFYKKDEWDDAVLRMAVALKDLLKIDGDPQLH